MSRAAARGPGRRVGKLTVRLERRGRGRQPWLEVELRLDATEGTFHAAYEGTWYAAKTKDELADKIRRAAEKTIDVEWSRYLVVDYTAHAWHLEGDSGRPSEHGSYEALSVEYDRAGLSRDTRSGRVRPRVVTSIDLHWSVCEFSTPYALPEAPGSSVRMSRDVDRVLDRDDDGRETYAEVVGQPREMDDDRLPAGAVPWTAERETLLRGLLAEIGQIDARMVELFRGDPDQVAARLDAAARRDPRRPISAPATDGDGE